jgi:hypothetical protein
MSANERQVGGQHYKVEQGKEQHWDRVARLGMDYFQGQITKYVERWKLKNGVQDLEKARHFLDKYIELNAPKLENPPLLEAKPARSNVALLECSNLNLIDFAEETIIKIGSVMHNTTSPETVAVLDYTRSLLATLAARLSALETVKTTGWTGYVYEGGTKEGDLYKCEECKVQFWVARGASPVLVHSHVVMDEMGGVEGDATPDYVGQ